jgi:hypothetical protein
MITSHLVRATLFAGVTATLAISSTVLAASQCKGLAESACTTDDSCLWVGAYQRSDGRQVSAHCRLGRSAKQAAKAQPLEAKASSAD